MNIPYCEVPQEVLITQKYVLFSHSYRASWYYQTFIYSPTDALVSCLKNNVNIYIKIYIKTIPTYFGVTVTPSSGRALICAY